MGQAAMSRASVHEYAAALRERYERAEKGERGRLLAEFVAVTGYHRKAAARLLREAPRGREVRADQPRIGRPRTWGVVERAALTTVWRASGQVCGKRLAPAVPELVRVLEAHGDLALPSTVRERLVTLSAATIDRLLGPVRRGDRQPYGGGTSSTRAIQAQVPIRTWSEWQAVPPGAVQADLVAHSGPSTAGFYLTTLTVVDVAVGWTELQPVWGKTQERVGGALHAVWDRFPVRLRDLHVDNGSEFLNALLLGACARHGITLTRGRPYRKNDQAWVEQKNGQSVRGVVGYDRYATQAALAALEAVYVPLCAHLNFFQPQRRLVAKRRDGATVHKQYDTAQTPYHRLLAAGVLSDTEQARLTARYQRLHPLRLQDQLEQALDHLWTLAERSGAPPTASAAD